MERLPIEMIAKISCYLSVADLVACSATCRTWREIFSDDMVWRRHCTLRLVEYLENTDTTVPPGLQLTEQSSLSSLPVWRTRFIRENHLWNNWRQSNFRIHEVVCNEGLGKTHAIFYENDYLVTVANDKVQFWDIRDKPICLINDPCELDYTLNIDQVELLSEDRILFVQSSKVSVFRISVTSSPWSLIHTFYFDERHLPEDFSEEGRSPPFYKDDDESIEEICFYVVSSDYFLGVAAGYSRLLHVWNINTGEKLKEVICPVRNPNSCFTGIYDSHKSSSDFLLLTEEDAEEEDCLLRVRMHVYVYNATELRFRDFIQTRIGRVNSLYSCRIFEPFVFIKDYFNLAIYNYKTSTLVHVMPAVSNPKIFNGNIIFVSQGSFIEFNVSTGATRQLTSFDAFSMFFIACDRFIAQLVDFYGFEVYEVGRREKQLQLDYSPNTSYWLSDKVAETNSMCTKKYVIENRGKVNSFHVCVLNYW
uniref:F-box domain-containing protein n=1 Tax=Homalodisca liturata TaxID=320908 RepID=A0A1B6K4G1_9HEMI